MFLSVQKKKRRVKTAEERLFAQNGAIVVERIEHRCFYDSTWTVRIADATYTVVRCDTETAPNLLREIMALPDTSEVSIKSLDERNKIYYD